MSVMECLSCLDRLYSLTAFNGPTQLNHIVHAVWCPVWQSAAAAVVTQTHRLSPTPGHIQVFVSAPVFTAHMTPTCRAHWDGMRGAGSDLAPTQHALHSSVPRIV